MGGANVCIFIVVFATISMDVKTHKNSTVYADNRKLIMFFAYPRHFTLYYQFPVAVQMHAFLRSICRHLHFIQNHTKTHTFWYDITTYWCYFVRFVCFIMFYLRCKNVAIYGGSEPLWKTIQFTWICHVRVACWLSAVWMGWAGLVGLAGLSWLGLLAGCLAACPFAVPFGLICWALGYH